jgi:antitoxin component YwqK of YwqJK toxin-antitoxin module
MKTIFLIFIFSIMINFSSLAQYWTKNCPYDLESANKVDSLGKKQGIWLIYDDAYLYYMAHYKNDTLHGAFEVYWFHNGVVSEKGFFVKNKIDGPFMAFWDNGQIRSIAFYNEGLLNGLFTSFDKNGRITSHLRYINNVVDDSYNEQILDHNVILDSEGKAIKVDTIIIVTSKNIIRKYVYHNNILVQDISIINKKLRSVRILENGIEVKRLLYRDKKPYTIRRIIYYENKKIVNRECFDKKGNQIVCDPKKVQIPKEQ